MASNGFHNNTKSSPEWGQWDNDSCSALEVGRQQEHDIVGVEEAEV